MTRLQPTKTRNDAILDFRKGPTLARMAKAKPLCARCVLDDRTKISEDCKLAVLLAAKCLLKRRKERGKRRRRRMVRLVSMTEEAIGTKEITFCGDESLFIVVDKGELTVEDKYKRTMQEIEVLRDELGKTSMFCADKCFSGENVCIHKLLTKCGELTSNYCLHFQLRERKSRGGPKTSLTG